MYLITQAKCSRWFRFILPIEFAQLQIAGHQRNIGNFGFVASSLEQQNIPVFDFR